MQYLEQYWTYLRQTFSIDAFSNKDERYLLRGHKVKFQGHMLENAPFCHVSAMCWQYWTEFHQTFSVDAFFDKDECFNVQSQKVKGQGHSMTKDPAGRGNRASMLCIKL